MNEGFLLRFSNGNQNRRKQNNTLFDSDEERTPLFTLRDRHKVGIVRVAKGRFEILYPAEAHEIMSHQRRYQNPPAPEAPAIQSLLRQAHEYQKLLENNPRLTRTELASQVGIDPSVLSRILNLLNLAPEIQRRILQMEPSIYQSPVSERRVREVARMESQESQIDVFNEIAAIKPRAQLAQRLNADPETDGVVLHLGMNNLAR